MKHETYREHSLSCSEPAYIFSIFITDTIFEILKFKVDSLYTASHEGCRLKCFMQGVHFIYCIDNFSKN